MRMTEEEYDDLMAHIDFIADKVEPCYKCEIDAVVRRLKDEYQECIGYDWDRDER